MRGSRPRGGERVNDLPRPVRGSALVQLNGLPSPDFDALVERIAALVDEPWDIDLMTAGAARHTAKPSSATAMA